MVSGLIKILTWCKRSVSWSKKCTKRMTSLEPLDLEVIAGLLHLWLSHIYYIYGQILLHVWLVVLLHLWLKVITFMVSITFMVNFYYIYGWYYIYGFSYIYGWYRLRYLSSSYLIKIWLSLWRHQWANLHILKTRIFLERKR